MVKSNNIKRGDTLEVRSREFWDCSSAINFKKHAKEYEPNVVYVEHNVDIVEVDGKERFYVDYVVKIGDGV